MSRWSQFVALGLAQLTGRQSLRDMRDVVSNLSAQGSKLYHLGAKTVSRSSLVRVNAEQPYHPLRNLFGRLLSRCRASAPTGSVEVAVATSPSEPLRPPTGDGVGLIH